MYNYQKIVLCKFSSLGMWKKHIENKFESTITYYWTSIYTIDHD